MPKPVPCVECRELKVLPVFRKRSEGGRATWLEVYMCACMYFPVTLLSWHLSQADLWHCCCCVASVVSDSVRSHRRQPTRLPRPWDSPGKNTEVGCHFLLQCMKVKSNREVTQSCLTLSDPMDCSLPGSSVHGIFQARVLEWGAIAFSMALLGATISFPHSAEFFFFFSV